MTGDQSMPQQLREQGGLPPGQDSLPSQDALTPTCSLGLGNLDMPILLTCTSVGCRKKLENLEEAMQTWGGGANCTQVVVPAGNLFFSLSSML